MKTDREAVKINIFKKELVVKAICTLQKVRPRTRLRMREERYRSSNPLMNPLMPLFWIYLCRSTCNVCIKSRVFKMLKLRYICAYVSLDISISDRSIRSSINHHGGKAGSIGSSGGRIRLREITFYIEKLVYLVPWLLVPVNIGLFLVINRKSIIISVPLLYFRQVRIRVAFTSLVRLQNENWFSCSICVLMYWIATLQSFSN